MALKLDNTLLEELGLGALPDSEKQLLLRQIYEKLEMNVGVRLANQMSNEQLDAFEKFVEANDDKGAFQWLETNFPNYKSVVNEEFEKLKAEIRDLAPQILASAQNNPADQGQPAVAAGAQSSPQYAPQPQPVPSPQPQPVPSPQPQPVPTPQPHQPYPPQPQYPPQQPPPAVVTQAGHLQPQYGAPAGQAPQHHDGTQPQQLQHPQQPQGPSQHQPYPPQQHQQPSQQYPPFPPQQPPAGSSQ